MTTVSRQPRPLSASSARHVLLHSRTDSSRFGDDAGFRVSRFEDAIDDQYGDDYTPHQDDVSTQVDEEVEHPLIRVSEPEVEYGSQMATTEQDAVRRYQDTQDDGVSRSGGGAPAAAVMLAKQAKRASASGTASSIKSAQSQTRQQGGGAVLVSTLREAFESSHSESRATTQHQQEAVTMAAKDAAKRSSRISARRSSLPAGVALANSPSPSIDDRRPTPPPKTQAPSYSNQSIGRTKTSTSSYGRSATPVSFKPIHSGQDSPDPRCVPHALLGPQHTSSLDEKERSRSPTPILTRMKSAFALKSSANTGSKPRRSDSINRLAGGDTSKGSISNGRATPTFSETSHAESAGHNTLSKVKSSLSLSLFRHRRGGRAENSVDASCDSTDYDAIRRSSSHLSQYSDWSFATMSSADSHGLPLPSEEPGSQERYVRKKSSVAASLLLGKIFKSKHRSTKASIDVDEVTATVERKREAQLRAQDSSMTLRPRRPSSSTRSIASTLSSSGSHLEPMAPRPALSLDRRQSAMLQRTAEQALVEPPQLPSFHFSRPSYSGDGFRVDPTELSYVSRFGYGADFEPPRQNEAATFGHHKRNSSGLPKRKGLRDVFDIDLKQENDSKLPQALPRRPSAADIGKVSTATANLENLLHDFQASPSTTNLTGQYSHQGSSPLTSSSEQHFAPGDSPTPLRKRSAQILRSESKLKGQLSTTRLSPLKLALSNQSREQPRLRVDTAVHRRDDSLSTDESSIDSSSCDHAQLPLPPVTMPHANKLSAAATLSPDEDAPRPSFDFTGEYNQLSKSADRTSFYEAMHDAGIEPATFETASRVSPVLPVAVRPRNVFYGIGTAFRLGGSSSPPTAEEGASVPAPAPSAVPKKHVPHNSVFSVNSMSSVGHVINTGIAGNNCVNVFDREFGNAFEIPGKPASDVQDWTSTSFARLKEREGFKSVEQYATAPRHYREPSNASIRNLASRPDVDSDRMFGTALRPMPSKPSSVFALSKARSAVTLEAVPKSAQESLDSGKKALARAPSLQAQSVASGSSASQVEEMLGRTPESSSTPASSSSHISCQLSVGKWATKGMFAATADGSICYESGNDTSAADVSMDTSSVRSRPAPPRIAAKRASSDGCNTPELLSPSATEMSSKLSTDVQSILSVTGPRHLQRPSILGTPAQAMNVIDEEASLDLIQSWVRLQQESDRMIGRSVEQWPDTPGSKSAMSSKSSTHHKAASTDVRLPAGFQPPSKTPEILAFLQSSVKLHRPLEEASPRRQIMWRESHEYNELAKTEEMTAPPVPKAETSNASQIPLMIPTKFSRTNSANSGILSMRSSVDGEANAPASDLLAKFVAPAASPAEPIVKPKPPRLIGSKPRPVAVKSPKFTSTNKAERPRVASTVRRVSHGNPMLLSRSLIPIPPPGTPRMESPPPLQRCQCARSTNRRQSGHRLGRTQVAHSSQAIVESCVQRRQGECDVSLLSHSRVFWAEISFSAGSRLPRPRNDSLLKQRSALQAKTTRNLRV